MIEQEPSKGALVSENGPEFAAEAHLEQHVQVFAVLECAEEPARTRRSYYKLVLVVVIVSEHVHTRIQVNK